MQQYWSSSYWSDQRTDSPEGGYYWSDQFWAEALPTNDRVGSIATTIDLVDSGSGRNYFANQHFSQSFFSSTYFGGGPRESAFVGTFTTATDFLGVISTTLGDGTAAFTGDVTQVQNFDVTVGFGVPWTITAFDVYSGSISATLDANAADFDGSFIQDSSFVGDIVATLDDATPNFDGTHVAPPNRTGTIGTTLDSHAANFDGTFSNLGVFSGIIGAVLENDAPAFTGTYDSGSFTGSISVSLDDYTANIDGIFVPAGTVRTGTINVALEDYSGVFVDTGLKGVDKPGISKRTKDKNIKSRSKDKSVRKKL